MGKQLGRRIYPDRAYNFMDLTGQVFGRLTVLSLSPKPQGDKKSYWECRCECGVYSRVYQGHLRSGHTKSCGCVLVGWCKETKTTHGQSGAFETLEYRTWQQMLNRCRNPKMENYYLYGGRGITVCERWHKYENFFADMGIKPTTEHSIERIDKNGDYEPSNCKWADRFEQANNKRNNKSITFNGETMNLFQWARKVGLRPQRLSARLISGWTIEKALTTPAISQTKRT